MKRFCLIWFTFSFCMLPLAAMEYVYHWEKKSEAEEKSQQKDAITLYMHEREQFLKEKQEPFPLDSTLTSERYYRHFINEMNDRVKEFFGNNLERIKVITSLQSGKLAVEYLFLHELKKYIANLDQLIVIDRIYKEESVPGMKALNMFKERIAKIYPETNIRVFKEISAFVEQIEQHVINKVDIFMLVNPTVGWKNIPQQGVKDDGLIIYSKGYLVIAFTKNEWKDLVTQQLGDPNLIEALHAISFAQDSLKRMAAIDEDPMMRENAKESVEQRFATIKGLLDKEIRTKNSGARKLFQAYEKLQEQFDMLLKQET